MTENSINGEQAVLYTTDELAMFMNTKETPADGDYDLRKAGKQYMLNPPEELPGDPPLILRDATRKSSPIGIPFIELTYSDGLDDTTTVAEFTVVDYKRVPTDMIEEAHSRREFSEE